MDSNFSSCENLPWTNQWDVKVLIHNSVVYVHSSMEVALQVDEWDHEYGEDGDHMASCMSLEDNFIVNAKEGNEEG